MTNDLVLGKAISIPTCPGWRAKPAKLRAHCAVPSHFPIPTCFPVSSHVYLPTPDSYPRAQTDGCHTAVDTVFESISRFC
ncbi:hypothetical protein PsYK624_044370 [Phanerochaete sordida]|uniref:Uncharacterized protein n=1 Tax=Phanerochaete sordida TaxID=48140 RepID=A0A9P3G6F4_9APHY|nr:hypothetical protein PsYK624_044370 [Phanerochaete sordida]